MVNLKFHLGIFLIGCLGALAPDIVRLYNLRTNRDFSWSWFYLLISLLLALLGGIIAWILPSTTYYGAFYAGAATPVLVSAIGRNADAKSVQRNIKEASIQNPSRPEAQSFPPIVQDGPESRSFLLALFLNYCRAL